MKTLLACLTLAVLPACNSQSNSTPKDAAGTAIEKAHWVCSEYDRSNQQLGQRTVVLHQTDDKGLREGEPMAFSLEIFTGADLTPDVSVDGKAEMEDVSFGFQSDDAKVSFHIYLDEMNESHLSLEGHERGDFVCR